MSEYDARRWFWIGWPDGAAATLIYSAAARAVVDESDAGYAAFRAGGNLPTPWPRDAAGVVTIAALDETLTLAGLPATGLASPPSRAAPMLTAVRGRLAAVLTTGAPVDGLHVALDAGSRADMTAMGATALAAATGAVAWPESYARGWITIENIRVALPTPADGLALAARVGNFYALSVQHARDLKDAIIEAGEDEAALDAIDIGSGWSAEG